MSQVSPNDDYGVPPLGFRLPPDSRIGAVRLQVADLARSVEYYTKVLGFRVRDSSDASAVLVGGDLETPLVELHESPGSSPVPRRGRLGLFHFAILLPDREALGALIAHLGSLHIPMGASDHSVSEAIYLQDPDGLGIEVYADRPRASWRLAGRELFMTTEPLDLGGLVRAAAGQPWSGLPVGTVIGHVHLSVGDLHRAEAFFHQGLGLDKVVWSYPGALFLSAGGYHHHLGTNTWATGAPSPTDKDARLLEWELLVPGEEQGRAAADNLASKGFSVTPEEGSWVAVDPWNTRLRIRVT